MNRRLCKLTLATAVAILPGLPTTSLLAQQEPPVMATTGRAFVIPKTERLHTTSVQLGSPLPVLRKGPHKGREQAGLTYSFVLHGTDRAGLVAIEFLDGSGNVVGRTTGRLTGTGGEGRPRKGTGQRQWKPTNFKELRFSESSVVNIDKDVTGTKLTITSDKEWAIVAKLGNPGTKE